jgi:hypothetical protein
VRVNREHGRRGGSAGDHHVVDAPAEPSPLSLAPHREVDDLETVRSQPLGNLIPTQRRRNTIAPPVAGMGDHGQAEADWPAVVEGRDEAEAVPRLVPVNAFDEPRRLLGRFVVRAAPKAST